MQAVNKTGSRRGKLTIICIFVCFIVVVFLSIFVFWILNQDNRMIESTFPSIAMARSVGEIDRGWIPDYLPESSINIREVHQIEHPKIWGSFYFSPSDIDKFKSNVTVIRSIPSEISGINNPGVSWWPSMLTGNVILSSTRLKNFIFYVKKERDIEYFNNKRRFLCIFAIDQSSGLGYFYETRY